MLTLEKFVEEQSHILEEYLVRKVGSFKATQDYYTQALRVLAEDFYSGLLSPDDVSGIAELLLTKVQNSPQQLSEFPEELTRLMEIEWELRNEPYRAAEILAGLKKHLTNVPS